MWFMTHQTQVECPTSQVRWVLVGVGLKLPPRASLNQRYSPDSVSLTITTRSSQGTILRQISTYCFDGRMRKKISFPLHQMTLRYLMFSPVWYVFAEYDLARAASYDCRNSLRNRCCHLTKYPRCLPDVVPIEGVRWPCVRGRDLCIRARQNIKVRQC